MLSADFSPIQIGMVYFENSTAMDEVGDLFEITFSGGAPGTELTELAINTDPAQQGVLEYGVPFFDTVAGGHGVYGYAPPAVVTNEGISSVAFEVDDGGTLLVIRLEGFHAGDRLVFSIDVDEGGPLQSAIVEGGEFEGSILSATFAAPHYYTAGDDGVFYDSFSAAWEASGLDLPPDSYSPPLDTDHPVHTAGVFFSVEQTPLPISLAGTVYEDGNLNNAQDSGEVGIAGVQLTLYKLSDGSYANTGLTSVTDVDGNYAFNDLLPGAYRVVETQPSGYLSVGAQAGTVDGVVRGEVTSVDVLSGITLLGGEDSIDNDFGEVRPASLGGHVYHDANNDGVFDSGENGIGGVTLTVHRIADSFPDAVIMVTTAADGSWAVDGLMPGEYYVEEQQPTAYLDGLDAAGTAGGVAHNPGDLINEIHLASGQAGENYDFGELLPAVISGRVYVHQDNNCMYDVGEPLLPGVTVHLRDASGNIIATTTTDEQGEYRFEGLLPGIYHVNEIQPDGYLDGCDQIGSAGGTLSSPDAIVNIPIASGTTGVDYNFGEVAPASISGWVYVDTNNDGVRAVGEMGIAGVTLVLLDGTGAPTGRTTVTNANGYYKFDALYPGEYRVAETQPAGYLDGLDAAGSHGGTAVNPGDLIRDIIIPFGAQAVEYNFGELEPASIAGRVWAEYDLDWVHDSGEPLLAGVTIYLLDADGARIAQTATDANGEYLFANLMPGTYGVEEIQPNGYYQGRTLVGTAGGNLSGVDIVVGAELSSGMVAVNYDFCEIVPASISGYVFQDGPTIVLGYKEAEPNVEDVRTGVYGADSKPIAGVVLRLANVVGQQMVDNVGNPITAVTDANGYYEFTGLYPGVYTIYQDHPDGYIDGIDTPGSGGGLVNNPGSPIDPMQLGLFSGEVTTDMIARVVVGAGEVAVSNNFSEVVFMRTPPYIPPPPNPPSPPLTPNYPPPFAAPPPMVGGPTIYQPILEGLLFGGSGAPAGWTWHLSVINAGMPRNWDSGSEFNQSSHGILFDPVTWTGSRVDQGKFTVLNPDGTTSDLATFGVSGATPLAADFNGDGRVQVAVFRDGIWFIDLNGNGIWDEDDLWAKLGDEGDQAVAGDWDGDGKADIGIFGPAWIGDPKAIAAKPGQPDAQNLSDGRYKNIPPALADATVGYRTMKRTERGRLRSDVIDHVFRYGTDVDRAVVGDWNGDGVATIGVFRNGTWYLDVDGNGRWSEHDVKVSFGQSGDVPVVGDWNGDGIDNLGVYRNGTWYLDTNGNLRLDAHDKVFELGGPHHKPVVGDFNGDGIDQPAVYEDVASADSGLMTP